MGAEPVQQETRVNTETKLLVMTVLRLLAVNTGFNKLGTETENSMTEAQKRDTTDTLRRAVVRRGTNTVNCLWLPVNDTKPGLYLRSPRAEKASCCRGMLCWKAVESFPSASHFIVVHSPVASEVIILERSISDPGLNPQSLIYPFASPLKRSAA